MNRRDIRVVDRVLSNVVLGYANPMMVGMELFPRVPVEMASGKIIQFGKEAFRLVNTRRAPGTATKRIKVGYEAGQYNLTNNALDAIVPIEWLADQQAVPGINLQRQSVETVMQIESNNLEYEQATLARDASKYSANKKVTLSGTDRWSDHDNSDPIKDVKDAKEAVRSTTGMYPNKMVIPSKVHNELCEHPKMLAKLSDNRMQILTPADYQIIFDIPRVVIAGSIVTDETDEFADLWGNDVILAYVPTVLSTNAMPSYGYTYSLRGHPNAERPWYDKTVKSWISGVDYQRAPLLTGIESGFLIQSAVAE